jgi:hypothetical protein
MNNAANGDVLVIPDNCVIKISSNSNESDNADGDFDFTDTSNPSAGEITIQGSGPGRSILDGDGRDRVLEVGENRTLNLVRLTVRNGDATNPDNGSDNAAGGIRVSGTLTAQNVVFVNNKGNNGGGVFDNGNGVITLTNVSLIGNTATTGDGGGAFIDVTQDTMTNVTVSGNSAPAGRGGGIFHFSGPLTLTNVTIANNTAGDTGGGIHVDGGFTTIKNTLIGRNVGTTSNPDCFFDTGAGGFISSNGNNLVQNKSTGCQFTNATGDVVNTDPLIEEVASNLEGPNPTFTHGLLPSSPAINGGATCPATDQRGVGRTGTCDIGAFEFTGSGVSVRASDVGYGPGDRLSLGALVHTGSTPLTGNVHAGLIMAPGFDPTCSGLTVVLLTSGGGFQVRCTSTHPLSSFAALAANVTVNPNTTINVDDILLVDPLPAVPPGPVQWFLLFGTLDPLDVEAVSMANFFLRTNP